MNLSAFVNDICAPLYTALNSRDAFERRRARIHVFPPILSLVSLAGGTKVASLIIQGIAVAMVYLLARVSKPKNPPVKLDGSFRIAAIPIGQLVGRMFGFPKVPLKPDRLMKIGVINNRMSDDLSAIK